MKSKEELKTLKDLFEIEDTIRDVSHNVALERVKAEAIKWVKNWQKQSWTSNPEPAEAFIDFFNLTSEDLIEVEK